MKRLATCLLLLALLPACASRNNYLLNRGADAADIFRGHLMFGPGVAAQVEVTRVLGLGVTYSHRVFAWGLGNREVGAWRESIWGWGLLVGQHAERETGRLGPISGSYGWDFGRSGGGLFEAPPGVSGLDLLTIRGTVMMVVGADIEIRLGELIDFFAGVATYDPAGDDLDYESMGQRGKKVPARP
ncbi:MAG: hypothetical protein ACI9EF_000937 [Pseudohongiellaceae bacterium]|jgi:hypothetical protein